jgi:CBS domain-containing protein
MGQPTKNVASARDLHFRECSIFKYPLAFVDKCNEPKLIMPLNREKCEQFRTMYLKEIPRNSFNGLPPETDAACEKWVDDIIENGIHLIAISFEKGIVGSASIFPMPNRMCEIMIVVMPSHRKRGIGTQLTCSIVEVAYEAGIEKIWLSVNAQNYIARHIYRKCGFEYINLDPSGELDMVLDLRHFIEAENVNVASIMNKNVVAVQMDAYCTTAIELFLANQVSALPVIDNRNTVIGILSGTDLIVESNFRQRVRDIMTRGVITASGNWSIAKVVRMFRTQRHRCFPVVDSRKKLVGIIGRRDIIAYYWSKMQA